VVDKYIEKGKASYELIPKYDWLAQQNKKLYSGENFSSSNKSLRPAGFCQPEGTYLTAKTIPNRKLRQGAGSFTL
jgi:hypothetical protein